MFSLSFCEQLKKQSEKMKILMKFVVFLLLHLTITEASFSNITNKISKIHENETKTFSEFFKLTENFMIDFDHENVSKSCRESQNLFKMSLQNLEYWALESKYSIYQYSISI